MLKRPTKNHWIMLIFIIAISAVILFMPSCKSFEKRAAERGYVKADSINSHTWDSVYMIDSVAHDTIIVENDSLIQILQLGCDSMGRIYVKDLSLYKGRILQLEQQLKNNTLYQKVVYKPFPIVFPTKFKFSKKIHIQEKTVYVEVRYIPLWVKILAWIGGISIVFYVGKILWRIYIKRYLDKNGGQLLR